MVLLEKKTWWNLVKSIKKTIKTSWNDFLEGRRRPENKEAYYVEMWSDMNPAETDDVNVVHALI